jgi:L(+)-tartrate dehydratase alpha subunit
LAVSRLRSFEMSLNVSTTPRPAEATASIPLRPNRVHPLTREDHNNNVGYHAPVCRRDCFNRVQFETYRH